MRNFKNNRRRFTHKKMTDLLNNIVNGYIKDMPTQVGLNLPKLKKVENKKSDDNQSLPKLKLPKLEKV